MKITNFRDLDVWKLGKEIVLRIYRVTALFPKDEVYGLAAQMRRASVRSTGSFFMWRWVPALSWTLR